jgi:hypothetical protein
MNRFASVADAAAAFQIVAMPPLLGLLSALGQFDGNSIVGNLNDL